MPDLAPGWQIRCPKCGNTHPYGKIGIRLFAASRGKRTLVFCAQCRRFRFAIVERTPTTDGKEPPSHKVVVEEW